MVCHAILRKNLTTPTSYTAALVGSLLFAASDNILAMLKFHHYKTVWGQVAVMATYYAAQYFILRAARYHELNKSHVE